MAWPRPASRSDKLRQRPPWLNRGATIVIANTAASDRWSESLDAGFGSVAGGLLSSGSVGLLTSGGSSTAMSLAMVTSTPATKAATCPSTSHRTGPAAAAWA